MKSTVPMHVNCQTCGTRFKRAAGAVKRQFCSRECWKQSRRLEPEPESRNCPACGESFQPSYKKRDQVFCSDGCQQVFFRARGSDAAREPEVVKKRGDKLRGRGEGKTYRKRDGRHEHRVVAEQKIGRGLEPGETVHHRDENKHNNDPGNLEVLPSQSEHMKEHWRQWRALKGGDAK